MLEEISEAFSASEIVYGHGTDNAWDEATYLVLSCANLPDDESSLDVNLDTAHVAKIKEIAERRIAERVPLAYLLGTCQYLGLTFAVQPGLVIPRSPIGFLLDELASWQVESPKTIYDFCTGTGCIGIAAALEFPGAEVTLVDLDPLAIEVSKANVERYGLSGRVSVVQADVTSYEPNQPADLILFNPPYVDDLDMATLPPEFLAEPKHGLAAGKDGLDILTPVVERCGELLSENGLFVGEVGRSAPALTRKFPEAPFIWLDLPEGGEGVFLLEERAISSHTARR